MPADPHQVEAVFAAALERASGTERLTYLDAACADQPELRQRVESLLQAHAEASGFLETPALPASSVNGTMLRYIGDYELQEELARGGMGVVYRARQLSLDRTVAVKLILSGRLASATEVRRFYQEAETAARLDHPHIVPLFEVGEQAGHHFFSMKLIEGGCLRVSEPPGGREPRQVAQLVATVARAVQHAHERGVLHRDLKPANILLDGQGQPHVSDFGLARVTEKNRHLTQSGAIAGTPEYMAPEQASSQKTLTTATDVYSLGAILYALLTGRPPLQGDGVAATLQQVVSAEPLSPRRLVPRLDRDLETVCLKCLEKEPGRRYASAAALADELDRWLTGEPITARPTPLWVKAGKWARRRPAVAALVAALLLVFMVGTTVSTMLYILASRRAEEAELASAAATQKGKAADDKAKELEQRNMEYAETLENLFSNAARRLFQPLGLQARPLNPQAPLTDMEIDTLWELAATKEDRLRLRFVAETLRDPALARQMTTRAALALHAAIGLNAARRSQIVELLSKGLQERASDPNGQVDVAVTLAHVGVHDAPLAGRVAVILFRSLSPYPAERQNELQGLSLVANRTESKAAAEAIESLCQVTPPKRDWSFPLTDMSAGLEMLAPRLNPTDAFGVARNLVHGLTRPRSGEDAADFSRLRCLQDRSHLTGALARVAQHLDSRDAAVIAASLREAMSLSTEPRVLGSLAELLGVVASRMESADAAVVTRQAIRVLTRALRPPFRASDWKPLLQGLSGLKEWIEVRAAGEIVASVSEVRTNLREWEKVELLWEALALVADHLERATAVRLVPEILQTLNSSPGGGHRGVQLVATVLRRLEANKAASLLTEAISQPTNISKLIHYLECVPVVAERLDPEGVGVIGKVLTQAIHAVNKRYEYVTTTALALSGSLAGLAPRLPAEDAAVIAASLVEVMIDSAKWYRCGFSEALEAVAARLQSREIELVADQVSRALSQTKDWDAKPEFAKLLTKLAARMTPKEAAVRLTEAAAKVRHDVVWRWLARGLVETASRMEPNEAALALGRAMNNMEMELSPLSENLVKVAKGIDANTAATVCTTLAETLNRANDTSSPFSLGEALAAVATQLNTTDAPRIAALLTQALGKFPDDRRADYPAKALAAVANQMEARQGAAVLSAAMSRTTSSNALFFLAKGVVAIAERLDEKEAVGVVDRSADRLLVVMKQRMKLHELKHLIEGLAALTPRLERDRIQTLCRDVADYSCQAITTCAASLKDQHISSSTFAYLTQALSGLVASRGFGDNSAVFEKVAVTLVQAMKKVEYPIELEALSHGVSPLAARMNPQAAAVVCGQASDLLVRAMQKEKDFFPQPLSSGLSSIARWMDPKDAARAATFLVELCDRPTLDDDSVSGAGFTPIGRPLSSSPDLSALSALSARMEPRVAATTLMRGRTSLVLLSEVLPRIEPREAAAILAEKLAGLRGKSVPESLLRATSATAARLASKDAARLASLLIQLMLSGKVEPSDEFLQALSWLAERLTPAETSALAALLLKHLGQRENQRAPLPPELLHLVAIRLNPQEEAQVRRQAADILFQAIRRTINTPEGPDLIGELLGVAARMEQGEAANLRWQLAALLIQAMGKLEANRWQSEQPPLAAVLAGEARSTLWERFSVPPFHEPKPLRENLPSTQMRRLVSASGLVAGCSGSGLSIAPLASAKLATHPVAAAIPAQMLVDLLKHPLCVGEPRRLVLEQLARHYQRSFASQWDFVDFAQQHNLGLDLTSPPRRPR